MSDTNWREMEAGSALDRVIAERLGWRVELSHTDHFAGSQEPVSWYFVRKPDGSTIPQEGFSISPGKPALWHTPELALEKANIPHYSTSTDAALTLPLLSGRYLVIYGPTLSDPTWAVEVWDQDESASRDDCLLAKKAATPALAIVRAWLEWQETQG